MKFPCLCRRSGLLSRRRLVWGLGLCVALIAVFAVFAADPVLAAPQVGETPVAQHGGGEASLKLPD